MPVARLAQQRPDRRQLALNVRLVRHLHPFTTTCADDLRMFSLGEHTLRDCILSTRCQYRPTHRGRPASTPYS
jgi:hypothetical protein